MVKVVLKLVVMEAQLLARVEQQVYCGRLWRTTPVVWAVLDSSDATTAVPRSLGTATPCDCFGSGKGFVTTGSTLGTALATTLGGALTGPSAEGTVVSRCLGAATPCTGGFGTDGVRTDDGVWALLCSACCTDCWADRKVGCHPAGGTAGCFRAAGCFVTAGCTVAAPPTGVGGSGPSFGFGLLIWTYVPIIVIPIFSGRVFATQDI